MSTTTSSIASPAYPGEDFVDAAYHEVTGLRQKQVLKGIRWLLLKNPEKLDEDRDERARLAEALDLNRPLAIAYYLKEDLRWFWHQPNRAAAERFLKGWCARADASGIRLLQKFANTLRGYRRGLLDWYTCRISTGPLEGVNNLALFKLRILSLHTTRFELVG